MNAPVNIQLSLIDAHRQAIESANCWRGRTVNLFARGELIIAQALLAEKDGKALPMLLSQRISRLSRSVAADMKKAAALNAFEQLSPDRNAIVHGSGSVYVDRDGKWLLTLHAVDRTGSVEQSVSQSDAEAKVRAFKSTIDRLAAAFA